MAPTTLETWARCPHRYFVRHILHVAIPERLDEQLRMTPRDRGSLLHEVFDRFVRGVLDGDLDLVAPDTPWSDQHRRAAHDLLTTAADAYHQAGRTGAALLWRYDLGRMRRDLDSWLSDDDVRRRTDVLRPVASEQGFGRSQSWPAAAVPLPDGRIVRFHGTIDRLDTDDLGRYHVTDYKTGSRSRTKLSQQDPTGSGAHLQLPVYAAAVAAHDGCSPIGIRSGFSFGRTAPQRVELHITSEVWDVFVRAVSVIADGISAGVFPLRPPEPVWTPFVECEVCDPDGLGTAEAFRDWQRKLGDPALRPYLDLIGIDAGGDQ